MDQSSQRPKAQAAAMGVSDTSPPAPVHIGWREWVALPELGVSAIKAKIDTGARTSAVHAWAIEPFRKKGSLWLRFELHPVQRSQNRRMLCEARIIDQRSVRNSGGQEETRYVIETLLELGALAWPIELTLADRDQMGFRMLLGRTALSRGVLVDPSRSYLTGLDKAPPRRKSAAKPATD